MEKNNLLTLTVSLIISLIVLEIGLRNFGPYLSYRVDHEKLGYVMNPSMSDIDENGFRNKKLASVDIVALGDSHTYGYNVSSDKSWPKLLGRKLKKNVYNFGVGGYGILQYQNLLSKAIELNPKVILLGLYLANDLNDICALAWESKAIESHVNISVCSEIKPNSALGAYANKKSNISIGKWLKENSAIITIVSKYYHRFSTPKRINVRGLNEIKKTEKSGGTNELVINDGKIKTMIDFRRIKLNKECMDMNSPHIQMAYEEFKKFFLESKKNTTLNNIHFGVLFIPSKARVFYEYLKQRDYCLSEDYEDLKNNEDKLKVMTSVFLKKIGLPFIDVLPDMENALLKHGDIYPARDDGHPILTGYEVYAENAFNLYQQIILSTGSNEN